MRTKITVQFKSSLRKEFLEKLVKTSFPNIKEYDLWKVPLVIGETESSVTSVEKLVWYLSVEPDDNFDVQFFLNVVKEIEADDAELENGFVLIGNNLATLLNSVETPVYYAETKNLKVEDKIKLDSAKLTAKLCDDINKIKGNHKSDRAYTLVTSVKTKDYWTVTQVKDAISNYFKSITMQFENQTIDISIRGYDDNDEYKTMNGTIDLNFVYPTNKPATFYIDISMSYLVFKALDCEDFDKFLTNEISNKKPLEHSYHTAVKENHYEVNFETTSMEEYMEIQATCRKIIDRSKLIPFHCICGHNFEIPKKSIVKSPYETDLCYLSRCPKCKTLCKTAMEQVK